MTSKTSFPERLREFRLTYWWAFRKNIGMMSLLAVLLFIGLPLILLIELPSRYKSYSQMPDATNAEILKYLSQSFTNYLHTVVPAFAMSLLLLFAVVFCIRLFGYMQHRRSVDLFHAFPVGRVPMLLGRWCAGITAMFLPILVNFGILELIAASWHIVPQNDRTARPAVLMLWILLMTAAAFTFCMFMAVCSGSILDTILSVLGVNVGYPIFLWGVIYLMESTLPGLSLSTQDNFGLMTLFAPFVAAYLPFFSVQAWLAPWWLFLTAVMLVGTVLLYQRRKSEAAEDQFAIPIPKVIIRFLLTAVGGIGLGLLIAYLNASIGGFLIGVLLGSAIVHVVVEAIYSRGFQHLKKSAVWYVIFVGAFAVFYGVIATGCFGYDTRIPNAADVESISVKADINYTQNQYVNTEQGKQIYLNPTLKNPENIRTVVEVHKNLLKMCRAQGYPYFPQKMSRNYPVTLTYHLKNGHSLCRTYSTFGQTDIDEKKYQNELVKIGNMPEYQINSDILFYLQPEDIRGVEVKSGETTLSNLTVKKELLDAMRKNYSDSIRHANDSGLQWMEVTLQNNIEPKDSRWNTILGNYTGKVHRDSISYYYKAGSEVDKLIQRMGWDK